MCYIGAMTRASLLLAALLSVGCAQPDVIDAALNGSLPELQKQIRADQKSGDLDRDRVEDLAEAVAQREVFSAKGEFAVDRVRQVRSCVRPLSEVLKKRSERQDDAAAEARMALLEAGIASRRPLLKYRDASSGAWRALAARASSTPADGPLRRRFFVDGDGRVRKAALHAAMQATDPADVEELLEVARLDPLEHARSLATRAAGAVGTERVVLALKDFWARADEPTRVTIVDAWAMPGAVKSGGLQQLIRVAETTDALPQLAAADALVRIGSDGADTGLVLIAKAITDGTTVERSLAIRMAPLDDRDALEAIRKAAKAADKKVAVMALARLHSVAKDRAESIKQLRVLAKEKGSVGEQARSALSAAGDQSVAPALRVDLKASEPGLRKLAAVNLARLGLYSEAASALGDSNPRVRTEVACRILSRRRASESARQR